MCKINVKVGLDIKNKIELVMWFNNKVVMFENCIDEMLESIELEYDDYEAKSIQWKINDFMAELSDGISNMGIHEVKTLLEISNRKDRTNMDNYFFIQEENLDESEIIDIIGKRQNSKEIIELLGL